MNLKLKALILITLLNEEYLVIKSFPVKMISTVAFTVDFFNSNLSMFISVSTVGTKDMGHYVSFNVNLLDPYPYISLLFNSFEDKP
ncbi:hypothetical protein NPIL_464471 [Nephila pilipes]|uniref:Uncharacterized protein n=1 Tax=Nephila pilipes TaxID=299642 RepID=A0A8X6N5L2_NEPPI|nr:hypothetical protein NPIL_464471 [Nephila pilipes]